MVCLRNNTKASLVRLRTRMKTVSGNEAGEVVRGRIMENLKDFGFDSKYHYHPWKVQTMGAITYVLHFQRVTLTVKEQ